MRILIIAENLANGGAERVASLIANYLSENNIVGIATTRDAKCKYALNEQIDFFPMLVEEKIKVFRMYKRILHLRSCISKFKPDVVISFNTYCNIYAVICSFFSSSKVIISERTDPRRYPINRIARLIRDFFYRFADGAVFQTEEARDYFNHSLIQRSTIIPNPINESFLIDPYYGERNNEIVTVCRLSPEKNLIFFIDVVAEIHKDYHDFLGVIYGDGPEFETLRDYIDKKNYKDFIKLAGNTNDVVHSIYKSKVFLNSSNFEGISNSIIEALTLGIPVVATDCPAGGTRMAVHNGYNGYLYSIGDKESAIKSIKKLICDKSLYTQFSSNAIQIRELWSPQKISNQWIDYAESITKKCR